MPALFFSAGGRRTVQEASIYKSPVELKLLELFESKFLQRGFRAVDVDCRIGGRSLVRFFIERNAQQDSEAFVSLEDCATVSRSLELELDSLFGDEPPLDLAGAQVQDDPDPFGVRLGPYDLEVSSPGLDRRLRVSSDFSKVVGQEIRLRLCEKTEPFGQNWQGTLVAIEGEQHESLLLSISKKEARVFLKDICRANLVWRPTKESLKDKRYGK